MSEAAAVLEAAVTDPEKKPAVSARLMEKRHAMHTTVVRVGDVAIGGGNPVVIAGPCSVESREQLLTAAQGVKAAGATLLRGGAYKPRTSPYDFQGLGPEALLILREASELTGLPVVSEVMSTDDIEVVSDHVDMLQVGARNMQNFPLLRRLGKLRSPVLLKRNPAATVKEWLLAAEYILAGGNDQVVLCERGVRSYDPDLRNTFDIGGMVLAKTLTHLPVIADPSHATGRRDLVPAVSRAALAAGADGLIVEVHPHPERALSDGAQSLNLDGFASMMMRLKPLLHEESSLCVRASL
jgi:3-deoxy-7-phosphoheptulonate synthase